MRAPTILICEDEPSLRELMRISLRSDYAFAEAADAAEAIALVDAVRPDVVLLDVMMPGGSGLSVLEHVRGNPELRDTLVVVISAFAADRDHRAAHDAGANSFLKKPFDPEELESLVEQLLASRN
jgi:two-component system, OmpR family, phosphate regulon response regulator PhoB